MPDLSAIEVRGLYRRAPSDAGAAPVQAACQAARRRDHRDGSRRGSSPAQLRTALIDSLRGYGTLFGSVFQAPQGVGGPRDEPATEERLHEPTPPAWRKVEVSIERDATRAHIYRRDLNLLAVRDAEG